MSDVKDEISDLEKRKVEVEKTFVKIGGEEFEVDHVMEFLGKVSGSDGFVDRGIWEHQYEDLAETLLEMGIINKTARGKWYENDKKCEKMYQELEEKLYEMHN